MIATRRRPFRFPFMAIVKTVGFFAGIYVLVRLPVTHALIFDGPLKPMWTQVGDMEQKFIAPSLDPILEPLYVVNLVHKVGDRNNEIIALKKQLRGAQYQQKLQRQQIRELQTKSTRKVAVKGAPLVGAQPLNESPAATTAGAPSTANAAPLVQITPSPDETKTAAYWSAMEAETAAGVAQKLEPAETARIFLAMKSDQAAEIMNALPADYNVKLQQVRLSFPKLSGNTP